MAATHYLALLILGLVTLPLVFASLSLPSSCPHSTQHVQVVAFITDYAEEVARTGAAYPGLDARAAECTFATPSHIFSLHWLLLEKTRRAAIAVYSYLPRIDHRKFLRLVCFGTLRFLNS